VLVFGGVRQGGQPQDFRQARVVKQNLDFLGLLLELLRLRRLLRAIRSAFVNRPRMSCSSDASSS
jgi:hypothetical protein